MKTMLRNKYIIILILALQLCGAIIFSTVKAKYLYGTNDNLFYFWRYGAFSLFGIIGGIACYFIPLEKLDRIFSKPIRQIITVTALLLYGLYWIGNNFYTLPYRISIWLDPYIDPNGAGYGIIHRIGVLQSAHIFGGIDAEINTHVSSEYILCYTAQRLGLVMICAVIVIMVVLVIFMFTICNKIAVPLCKFISFIILLYITFSFVWNIAATFNWLPVSSSHFPFISYNRFTLIFDLCMMGIFIRMTTVGILENTEAEV
jgi:Bacterial cell division membrane protein